MAKAVSQRDNLTQRIAELEQEIEELKGFKSIKRDQSEFTGNKTQLRMILEASEKNDVSTWNAWRKKHPKIRPNLRGADLTDCSLLGINLAGANLNDAVFDYAALHNANFNDAQLNFCSADFITAPYAQFKNAQIKDSSLVRADLRGANLTAAKLSDTVLSKADFEKAMMHKIDLSRASIDNAILTSVDLSNAKLDEVDLNRASLEECNLNNISMRDADAKWSNFSSSTFRKADLRRVNFFGANLNGADLSGANMQGAFVQGTNVWDVTYDKKTIQTDLSIEIRHQRVGDFYDITFDNLEMAHLISLFLQNPKWENIFNVSTSKLVLILGRFSEPSRFQILKMLREELPRYDYVPVVFDFDEPTARDTVEVVATLAGLSRFVICDLTQPRSTPLETHVIVPMLSIPFVPIIHKGEKEFSMFKALKKYKWVLPTLEYSSKKQLFENLSKAILQPAEKKLRQLLKEKSAEKLKPIPIDQYI